MTAGSRSSAPSSRRKILDVNFTPLCTIEFEADAASLTDASSLNAIDAIGAASGPIERAWSLDLDTATSDCDQLDAKVFGTDNIVDYMNTTYDFVYGLGEINAMDSVGSAAWGADWTGGIEPVVHSEYISIDGTNAVEVSIGALFDTDDCLVVDTAGGVFFRPAGANGVVGNLSTVLRNVVFFL